MRIEPCTRSRFAASTSNCSASSVCRCGLSHARTEGRPLQYVRQLVQPALECLRRELALRSKLGSREQDLGVRERDLSLMLEMSSSQTATGDADEFDLILKTGLEHMGCALAALWIPDKGVAMSMTRSGNPMAPESLQRAQQHLMAWMQLQQRTIVVNHISKVASDVAAPYKILACPVRHPSERVMGVLALFNPPSAHDFDEHQTRIAELLAKKAMFAIQAQYDSSTGLMTRHAFERQAAALLASAAESDTKLHSLSGHRSAARHQRNLRHARRRRRDRQSGRVPGEVAARFGPVGAHLGRPPGCARFRTPTWSRPPRSPNSSAQAPPPSHRAPDTGRSKFRCASASPRSAAPKTRWPMRWRPPKSPARRPRIAVAIGSKYSRTPTRASSGAIPTFW